MNQEQIHHLRKRYPAAFEAFKKLAEQKEGAGENEVVDGLVALACFAESRKLDVFFQPLMLAAEIIKFSDSQSTEKIKPTSIASGDETLPRMLIMEVRQLFPDKNMASVSAEIDMADLRAADSIQEVKDYLYDVVTLLNSKINEKIGEERGQ